MKTPLTSKKNKKLQVNELDDDIYRKSKIPFYKIISLMIVLVVVGFAINYPLADSLKHAITTNLSRSACPIFIEEIQLRILPPSVILKKPVISQKCLPKSSSNITLKDIYIYALFPNIYPFGLKFKLEINDLKSKINLYFIASIFTQIIKIKDTTINTKVIDLFTNGHRFIDGNINLKGLAEFQKNNITSATFSVKSSDLSLLKQNLSGLLVPQLPINNLYLEGTFKRSILNISSLVIGNESSPIIAKSKGKIEMNALNVFHSQIGMTGQAKFSNEFINLFPILNLLLSSKHSDNGFYNFEVKGTLAKPLPKLI